MVTLCDAVVFRVSLTKSGHTTFPLDTLKIEIYIQYIYKKKLFNCAIVFEI